MLDIFVTEDVSNNGTVRSSAHVCNMFVILVTEDVSNNGRVSIDVPCNMLDIFVTEDVSNSGRLLSLLQF